jgi:surface protein
LGVEGVSSKTKTPLSDFTRRPNSLPKITKTLSNDSTLRPKPPLQFDNATLHFAVREWLHDHTTAEVKYGHISDWDTSQVRNMSLLFFVPNVNKFNQDLSRWNTSNVTDMHMMFYGATAFDQPLPWNTSNVTDMHMMFCEATAFNRPLKWNTSNVTDMRTMFGDATAFNQPLPWNTSKVTDMRTMFLSATAFSQPLPWNTGNVRDMGMMFFDATAFNQPLPWNTGNVTDMNGMFRYATAFNQPLNWDTRRVRDMQGIFEKAPLMLRRYPDGKLPIDRWEQVRKQVMHGRRRWHWQDPCEVDQNVPLEVLRGWADEYGIPLHHPDTQRPKTKRELCADLARWWDAQREEQRATIPRCDNDSSLWTGDEVGAIPSEFFYPYTHDGRLYCEDIRSLHKYVRLSPSASSPQCPYNRQPFRPELVDDIKASYDRLNRRAVHLDDFDGPVHAWLSFEQRFSQKLADLMLRLIHPVDSERLRDASEGVWAGFLKALVSEGVLSDAQRYKAQQQADLDQKKFFVVELLVHKIDNDPQHVDTPQGRLSAIAVSVSNVVNGIFGVM